MVKLEIPELKALRLAMPQAVRRDETPAVLDGLVERAPMIEEHGRSFLRVVSHELRTPLNSILGFSEILASELYGPLGADQYREYAEIIRSSGEKLLKLVNQVVEIARLQTGDMDFELRSESLTPILEDLHEGLHEMLAARRLRLCVEPCGNLDVLTDSRGLHSVLTNLLQNAIAFSPDGGTITVRSEHGGGQLEIIVTNEGEGVDQDDLPRLLRPFEQGGAALTRHAEGAGLGLSICDLTCRALGGRLGLSSAPGQGFSAHIFLPTA